MVFIKKSRHTDEVIYYPLALLGDIEIHFLHYKNEFEVKEKWSRRILRINWDNLFLKMNDSDGADENILKLFDKNKVIFSSKNYSDIKSLIWFKKYNNKKCIENGKDIKVYRKYFNVERWLDNNI